MRHALLACAILLGAALSTQAYTDAATAAPTAVAPQQTKKSSAPVRKTGTSQSSSNEVTYDRDSKDPNVGWHTQGGMRVCTEDCDNPEIPGSGYACKNVNFLGMAMRECTESNW
jgi:hypothetical protein